MLFAIVKNPLDNTQYFAGYRFTNAPTPYWSDDTMAVYQTSRLANEVASELGEGIVVMIELHYSKTPTITEIDNLTNNYDGDI